MNKSVCIYYVCLVEIFVSVVMVVVIIIIGQFAFLRLNALSLDQSTTVCFVDNENDLSKTILPFFFLSINDFLLLFGRFFTLRYHFLQFQMLIILFKNFYQKFCKIIYCPYQFSFDLIFFSFFIFLKFKFKSVNK